MFRRKVQPLSALINQFLRQEGLETPLLQKRLLDAWVEVMGATIDGYTAEKAIRNQTLFIKLTSPALRADLSMMRTELIKKLNSKVGAMIITDIRFY